MRLKTIEAIRSDGSDKPHSKLPRETCVTYYGGEVPLEYTRKQGLHYPRPTYEEDDKMTVYNHNRRVNAERARRRRRALEKRRTSRPRPVIHDDEVPHNA